MCAYSIVLPTNLKPAALHIFTHRIRYRSKSPGRPVACRQRLMHRLAVDETPDVIGKAAKFFPYGPGIFRAFVTAASILRRLRMIDGSVTSLSIFRGVKRATLSRIEPCKCPAIAFPLMQYRRPTESRLRALEDEEFELSCIVTGGHAPLTVVIGLVRIADAMAPWASTLSGLRHRYFRPPSKNTRNLVR